MQLSSLLLVLLCTFVQDGQGQDKCPKLTNRMVNDLGRYAKHQCDLWDCGDVDNQECVAAGITCGSGAGRCADDKVCCQSKTIPTIVPTVCPEPFDLSGKTCLFGRMRVATETLTFSNAKAACEDMGARLPRIDTAEENDAVLAAIAATGGGAAHIGLNDMATETSFVWAGSESTLPTYYNWADGSGPSSNTEVDNCASIIMPSGKWILSRCYNTRNVLVCETSPVPVPATP